MLLTTVTRRVLLAVTATLAFVVGLVADSDDSTGAIPSGFHAAATILYLVLVPLKGGSPDLALEIIGLQLLQLIGLLMADSVFWKALSLMLAVFYGVLLTKAANDKQD